MKKNTKVAHRYAKALFDLCIERNELEIARGDVGMIRSMVEDNRELRLVLDSPVINPEKKVAIMNALLAERVSKTVMGFILILVRKRREPFIHGIAAEFIKLYNEYKGLVSVFLSYAAPIDASTRERLSLIVKKTTGRTPIFIETTDPSLIGGFVLSMDDYTLNASVQYELDKLRKEFQENIFIGKL